MLGRAVISPSGIPSEEAFGTAKVDAYPEILFQHAITVSGGKTSEGLIIEAVTPAWFAILEQLERDPTFIYEFARYPRKFEEMIAGAYKKAGFDAITLTRSSGDLGRDVIAVKYGIGSVRVIDQVKAYKPGHLVTANDVRALMGVLQNDGAAKGFLTTTSDFAPKLKEDPLIVPFMPSRLELINGSMLLKRLEELAKKK
jgi:restriction system protein